MRPVLRKSAMTVTFVASAAAMLQACANDGDRDDQGRHRGSDSSIQVGQRPFYLVDGMDESPLKHRLMQCRNGPFVRTDFSIGHRGAALQFPEHTLEAYNAGARMGAGIVECDTTFTRDGQLVCRHAENDLHATTNILVTPLAVSARPSTSFASTLYISATKCASLWRPSPTSPAPIYTFPPPGPILGLSRRWTTRIW